MMHSIRFIKCFRLNSHLWYKFMIWNSIQETLLTQY